MKAKQKLALPIGTPKISKLGSPDCFISGGKEFKHLQLNTSHLDVNVKTQGGDPALESKSGLYTKMTLNRQVYHHPDTKHGTGEDKSYPW